jgi:hypothetical protein
MKCNRCGLWDQDHTYYFQRKQHHLDTHHQEEVTRCLTTLCSLKQTVLCVEPALLATIIKLVKALLMVKHVSIKCTKGEIYGSHDIVEAWGVQQCFICCDLSCDLVFSSRDDITPFFNTLMYRALCQLVHGLSGQLDDGTVICQSSGGIPKKPLWKDRIHLQWYKLHLHEDLPKSNPELFTLILDAMSLKLEKLSPLLLHGLE